MHKTNSKSQKKSYLSIIRPAKKATQRDKDPVQEENLKQTPNNDKNSKKSVINIKVSTVLWLWVLTWKANYKKTKEVNKTSSTFTDLSVLNRSNQTLSSKTKKHLENYNKQMAKRRISRMSNLKDKEHLKGTIKEEPVQTSPNNSLLVQSKSYRSTSNYKETIISKNENNAFNISKK
jgi:hypothetical protein